MSTFVDTSALYALLDADDAQHRTAATTLRRLIEADEQLVTHSYVLVEMAAITQRRLGADGVRALFRQALPSIDVVWVDEATHAAGAAALLAALPTSVSLVDFVSFEVMRQRGVDRAFAFDRDFSTAGFEIVS